MEWLPMPPAEGRGALSRTGRTLIIAFLSVVGLAVRLDRIFDPPLDFHPTRQYRSAILARGCYYSSAPSIPEWKREIAGLNQSSEGLLEPPVMEQFACLAYRLSGSEHLWVPRAFSSILWVAGGILLYRCARRIASAGAALCSIGYYLFLPFGIAASRSFQPDPLMVVLIVGSLLTLLRYDEKRSVSRLATTALVAAGAVFVKPVSLFAILGAFLALRIRERGLRKATVDPHLWIFVGASLLPAAAYAFYEMLLVKGALRDQAFGSFRPELLLRCAYYGGWLRQIRRSVGVASVGAAVLGLLTVGKGRRQALLLGLCSGYLCFALAFTYHIHTHNYYQLQLIPIVALCLAPAFDAIVHRLDQPRRRGYLRVCLVVIALGTIAYPIYAHRRSRAGGERTVATAQEVGDIVEHSRRIIFLAPDYGMPLKYHGEVAGWIWWDSRELRLRAEQRGGPVPSVEDRFVQIQKESSPEYFVVTDLKEFEAQPDLERFLRKRFPVKESERSISAPR